MRPQRRGLTVSPPIKKGKEKDNRGKRKESGPLKQSHQLNLFAVLLVNLLKFCTILSTHLANTARLIQSETPPLSVVRRSILPRDQQCSGAGRSIEIVVACWQVAVVDKQVYKKDVKRRKLFRGQGSRWSGRLYSTRPQSGRKEEERSLHKIRWEGSSSGGQLQWR